MTDARLLAAVSSNSRGSKRLELRFDLEAFGGRPPSSFKVTLALLLPAKRGDVSSQKAERIRPLLVT